MGKKSTRPAKGATRVPARKRPIELRGMLLSRKAGDYEGRPGFASTWGKMKDNLLVLADPDTGKVTYLNQELATIARRFDGTRITITIEQDESRGKEGLPDPDREFQGTERAKRIALNLFKIS